MLNLSVFIFMKRGDTKSFDKVHWTDDVAQPKFLCHLENSKDFNEILRLFGISSRISWVGH